jgi:hypothetical protein
LNRIRTCRLYAAMYSQYAQRKHRRRRRPAVSGTIQDLVALAEDMQRREKPQPEMPAD